MPEYVEPIDSPVSKPGSDYPLVLAAARSINYCDQQHRNPGRFRSTQKLRDRCGYLAAPLDWQHVRFPFEEMDLGAGNQTGPDHSGSGRDAAEKGRSEEPVSTKEVSSV